MTSISSGSHSRLRTCPEPDSPGTLLELMTVSVARAVKPGDAAVGSPVTGLAATKSAPPGAGVLVRKRLGRHRMESARPRCRDREQRWDGAVAGDPPGRRTSVRRPRGEGKGGHLIDFHWANELAKERIRDGLRAYQDRELVLIAIQDRPAHRSFVRRPTVLLLAALSRRTAVIVRRVRGRGPRARSVHNRRHGSMDPVTDRLRRLVRSILSATPAQAGLKGQ